MIRINRFEAYVWALMKIPWSLDSWWQIETFSYGRTVSNRSYGEVVDCALEGLEYIQ